VWSIKEAGKQGISLGETMASRAPALRVVSEQYGRPQSSCYFITGRILAYADNQMPISRRRQ